METVNRQAVAAHMVNYENGARYITGPVDAVICDPPYGARCHTGNDTKIAGRITPIAYKPWSAEDVARFVDFWDPITRGWIVSMTSHDLIPAWEEAHRLAGRYVFHPIPYVHAGMSCRMRGDGPSSWAVWIMLRVQERAKWRNGEPFPAPMFCHPAATIGQRAS